MTQLPLTLPAYTPARWELVLPDYPVITSSFRSVSFPEVLGSLPSDSRWKLYFDNMSSEQALALLLPWRATGMGMWPLTTLPDALAGGVDSIEFRKRLTGTTWTIEKEPSMDSVKNNRFNIVIELIYELTFSSIYGPRRPDSALGTNPVLLNIGNAMTVAGTLASIDPALPATITISGPALSLGLEWGLVDAGVPVDLG